jgi:transposase
MVPLQSETNLDVLRQVSQLLWSENERRVAEVRRLVREIAELRGLDAAQLELAVLAGLAEKLDAVVSAPAGRAAEPARERPPQKGHGPREQTQLPRVEVRHELPEEQRQCSLCGGELEEMAGQGEESEEITVVERRFEVRRHVRLKYRCRCNGCVVTAPGPAKLIAGGRYSPELAVEVAVDKYLDHQPLERQARAMRREGLEVDSHTLWDQLNAAARHVQPSYEELGRRALASPVVHVDETRWPLLGKDQPSKWSKWTVTTAEVAFYRVTDGKSADEGREVLGKYQGIVVADGFGVYEKLARGDPGFRLANCWAHARRKFEELRQNFPLQAEAMIDLIGELYAAEAEVSKPFALDEEALRRRTELRAEKSREIVEKIRGWCTAQLALPRSELGQAIGYLLGRWDGLTLFLAEPRVPLDNNAAERALRGPVVGRKNHYGSKSKRGTQVAALFYTLCETAKLRGVDPKAYLRQALFAAIASPGAVTLPE